MKPILFIFTVLIMTVLINSSVYSQPDEFTITNTSGMAVTSVSVSPAGQNEWGPNILYRTFLRNDESVDIRRYNDENNESIDFVRLGLSHGCIKDVKYTTEDGKIYLLLNVNMCSSSSITLLSPFYLNKKKDDGGGY